MTFPCGGLSWISRISAGMSRACGHGLMHRYGIIAFDEYGFIAVAEKGPGVRHRRCARAQSDSAILYPFRCRIGSTAPSRAGLRNLFECQLAARALFRLRHRPRRRPQLDLDYRTPHRTHGAWNNPIRRLHELNLAFPARHGLESRKARRIAGTAALFRRDSARG